MRIAYATSWKAEALPEIFVVDFTNTAQMSRTYDEYGAQIPP